MTGATVTLYFVPKTVFTTYPINMKEFLGHFVELVPGEVLSLKGEQIGVHHGALLYTLGQRHGFAITEEDPNRRPYYVVDKDITANTITVSPTLAVSKPGEEINLQHTNWIPKNPSPGKYLAQFRYRQTPVQVELLSCPTDGPARLVTVDQVERPARGQSCVLYQGDTCLGGGIIS